MPDLAGLLGGMQQGPPPAPPQGPQYGGGGQSDGPDTPQSADLLKQAIDSLLQAYKDEQDEQDRAEISKCVAAIQKILGARQADTQQVLGNSSVQRVLRRG